jgi:hypothetical protein
LRKVLITKTKTEIDELPEDKRNKYHEEFDELSKIRLIFESINTELLETEVEINKNHLRQAKSKEMLEKNAFKKLIPEIQKKLDELKTEEIALNKKLITLYKKKTDKIYDILQQVNSKYKNPYVLLQNLESSALKGLASLLLGL